jgi:hypothetical protein
MNDPVHGRLAVDRVDPRRERRELSCAVRDVAEDRSVVGLAAAGLIGTPFPAPALSVAPSATSTTIIATTVFRLMPFLLRRVGRLDRTASCAPIG